MRTGTLLFAAVLALGTARAEPPPSKGADAPDAGAGETLIREFMGLEVPAGQDGLDRFVAEHPALLGAKAAPYGSALMWVLEFEREPHVLALLRAGAPVSLGGGGKADPLHVAARGGLDAVVKELLARGAKVDAESYWGTPLHYAAKQGHASTMRLLLQAGAKPGAAARDHLFTPLHQAVIGRHIEAVKVLLEAGADLGARDDDGWTALHWGSFAYRPQPMHIYGEPGEPHDTVFTDPGPATAMQLLLDAGAQVDAVNQAGNTPLHEAVRLASMRAAELLVSRGANVEAKNHAGETPRALIREDNPEMRKVLERAAR